jgi:hypothetical protein
VDSSGRILVWSGLPGDGSVAMEPPTGRHHFWLKSEFPTVAESARRMNHLDSPLRSLFVLGLLVASAPVRAEDWPQWGGPLRMGVWREDGILERFPPEGPGVRWRTAIGPGFSGPAVADGRVFLMDRGVDENAPSDVKTQWNHRDKTEGQERVLCLNEATGQVVWTYAYACAYETAYGSGPRATPTVSGPGLYARRHGRPPLPRCGYRRVGVA